MEGSGLNRFDPATGNVVRYQHHASDPTSLASNNIAAIPVAITPPLWRTWWFIAALIIVLGALIAGGFRVRLNSIRKQNIHLETQVSERISELRETNKLLEKEVEHRKRAEAELEKRAAQELQQSEERFRAMFEHSAVGIGVISLDRTVLDANPAFLRIFGGTPEDTIGSNASDVTFADDNAEALRLGNELINGERDFYQLERR